MKRVLLIAMFLTAVSMSAAFVPLEKAKKVAENYYGHYCSEAASKGSAVINVQENKYEGLITRYTFEFDKGFVIVTADDGLYPILGYSDHGKVPKADQNGGQNFKEWFEKYDQQVFCAKSKKYIDEDAAKLWKDIENNIFPAGKAGIIIDRLVKSQWDQVYPWNDDCPLKSNGNWTYVGCTATAMAQVLRYHRWPDAGTGSASYIWNNGAMNLTLSADFTTHTWNYDLMPEIVDIEYGIYPAYWETGITQAEVDELALQSYWMGISLSMYYGDIIDGGSGAYMSDIDNAFVDHWKGTSTFATFATPVIGGVDASYNTIKAQLDAKRPWVWAGDVHAFVLDGYRDDYWYHFNWGWQGYYDGWYHRSYIGDALCDYSAGQIGVTYVPSTNPFNAWPTTTVSGSLANGEDVTVNWTACAGATGYKIYRTKDKESVPSLLETTTNLSYSDMDMPEGEYAYHVVVTYATGESHNSNSYNTQITAVRAYPKVLYLDAVPEGRTSIDLAWTKPFTDILYHYVNFENPYGTLPTGWLEKTSYDAVAGSCWTFDPNNWIVIYHKDDLSNWLYQNRIEGYCLLMSAAATQTLWLFSPPVTFADGSYIKWWNRFRYTDNLGVPVSQRPVFQIISYSGDFSEERRETNIVYTQHALYDGSVSPENIWEYEETCDLSALDNTTTRIGFRVAVNTNDLYTLAFDKITIASTDPSPIEDCSGYEIYRNGTLAATLNNGAIDTWSDTGFIDGDNTYYMRALYPTGTSIPSDHVIATIDAYPKPDFLTGTVAPATQVNLSWYAPSHNAPKWYTYFDPCYANSFTTLYDPLTPIDQKRTRFAASDLGYYYPITLDSIAAIFYDKDEGNWGGENQFIFRVFKGYGTSADTVLTVYHTSHSLTAVHNKLVKYALPTPLVLTEDFNIEVINLYGTDNPTNLMKTVDRSHSYYMGTDGKYFASISNSTAGLDYEWSFFGYITSSSPSKDGGWVGKSEALVPATSTRAVTDPKQILTPYEGKALDYYKIYRNNVAIGTSTTINYADSGVPATGDYTYKVTAYYTNPAGESDPTNEIVAYNVIGTPALPFPQNVNTLLSGGSIIINWDDLIGATSYNIYASDNPYGTFTLITSVAVSEYTYTAAASKKFFYITGVNNSKEQPKTIIVPEKKEK